MQTPPSVWLVAFLLPPSCVESSAVSVNPGLRCPAVCIPLLLGEHGMAPGPLCSHRRVNERREAERQAATENERQTDRERGRRCSFMTVTAACRSTALHCYWVSVTHTLTHTLSINKRERRGRGRMAAGLSQQWVQMWMKKEETSVTSWVLPHCILSLRIRCIFLTVHTKGIKLFFFQICYWHIWNTESLWHGVSHQRNWGVWKHGAEVPPAGTDWKDLAQAPGTVSISTFTLYNKCVCVYKVCVCLVWLCVTAKWFIFNTFKRAILYVYSFKKILERVWIS